MHDDEDQVFTSTLNEEATSSETLRDVEETEQITDDVDDKGSSFLPSPDGDVDSNKATRENKEDEGLI